LALTQGVLKESYVRFSEERAMDFMEESVKLRSKAEKIRTKALSINDPHLRDELLSICEQYQGLASRAEEAHLRLQANVIGA
jgi:hypothetical protein